MDDTIRDSCHLWMLCLHKIAFAIEDSSRSSDRESCVIEHTIHLSCDNRRSRKMAMLLLRVSDAFFDMVFFELHHEINASLGVTCAPSMPLFAAAAASIKVS